jgi:hypothetical protein
MQRGSQDGHALHSATSGSTKQQLFSTIKQGAGLLQTMVPLALISPAVAAAAAAAATGVMRIFAKDKSLPALVHCAHGKDRTGVVIMLLLLVCDVPHEAIVQDYVQVR